METSTSLLDRLRDRPDEESWRRLDSLYRPLIRRWLQRDPVLNDEAEDLAQDVMVVVCSELPGFQRNRTGSFRKWLRTITAYRVKACYRARRSRPEAIGVPTEDGLLVQLADDRSELAQRWDREHNEHVVRRLLELMAGEFSDAHLRAFRRVVLDSVLPTVPPSPSNTSLPVRQPAEVRADDVPPELLCSPKFEILGKLGKGGMGAVYKARHTFLNELVAIKVMSAAVVENPEARSRFLREMQAMGKLKHPNIVRALDAEQIGDLLLLVMEYVPGVALDRIVKQRGPLPVDFACNFIAQAALGLQHAHEKGMVHRDIKPANLMVTAKEKEVKVLDFGLVRGPREPGEKNNQTQLEMFMGTPEYVAPEQATDARSADIRADLYSLGCTLYFLLTGWPPFQKDTVLNTIMAQVHDEAQPLSEVRKEVPAELGTVVAKMMAKKPIARYQTPLEAARALRPFVGGGKARRGETRPVEASEAIDLNAPTVLPAPAPPMLMNGWDPVLPFVAPAAPSASMPPVSKPQKATGAQVVKDALGPPRVKPEPVKPPAREALSVAARPATITNSIGMKLVRIPAGTFTMESPTDEEERSCNEEQHEVEITKAFYMGVYTVTQAEYKEVMGKNPSWFSADGGGKAKVTGRDTSKFPVEMVSWMDATRFCDTLSALAKEKAAGKEYRLPTEAEWEYACRAGTRTKYHSGDEEEDLKKVAWYSANSDSRTHTVGKKKPNAWGLYDMHGNVWQWCSDWYDKDYYHKSDKKDPHSTEDGASRVLRGGLWSYFARYCRAAIRSNFAPGNRDGSIGFRVVCVPARSR